MCCTLSQKILHLKGNNTFAITLYQYYEMNRLIGQFIFTCFINSKQLFRITCHLLVLKTGMISWTFIHWREIRQNLRISVIQRRKLTAFFTASGCKNLLTPSSWLYDFYQTVKNRLSDFSKNPLHTCKTNPIRAVYSCTFILFIEN